jgi:alpha-L-rhamnosidase
MATLFSRFGGVQPLEAEFRRFIVKPAVIDSLDWVQVIIETVRGRLQSKWQRQGKTFSLQVEVPVGAQADVHIPLARAGAVFESGRPAAEVVGVQYLGEDAQNRLYRVGSGVYCFSTRQ